MVYSDTTALRKILALNKRLKIIQGGTSAGKTIAILLILIDIAQKQPGKLISVVSETFPHLKKGAIRDFISIMEGHRYFKEGNWNKTDSLYTFESGSKIEFFSADSSDKVRGPRRDILFINECNNINFETYTQLAIRTNDVIFLDFNPVSEFWVHSEIIPKLEHDFIVLTYKDNEALPDTIVKEIESRRANKYFWKVYGLGLLGEAEGKIYTGWNIIDEVPHEARLERYGLDFGYTNDPSALVAVYYYNGGYVLDELLYEKGMMNDQLAGFIKNQKKALVVADSAEPKSIDEIKLYGVNITGAKKVKQRWGTNLSYNKWAIGVVQAQRISVTKRSINLIKEYRNYLWQVDKDGRTLNEPEGGMDHALDAIKYAIVSIAPIITKQEILSYMPIIHSQPRQNPAR